MCLVYPKLSLIIYHLADKDELIVIRSDESLDVHSGADSLDNELTDLVSFFFLYGSVALIMHICRKL